MTQTTLHTPASIAYLGDHQPLPLLADIAVRVAVTITKWQTRRTSRKALSRLEDDMLGDIGVTRRQASDESRLWFWQP